jgi:hypothetical protein
MNKNDNLSSRNSNRKTDTEDNKIKKYIIKGMTNLI